MKRQPIDIYRKYKIRWCTVLVKRMKENGLKNEEWVDRQVVISIKQRSFLSKTFKKRLMSSYFSYCINIYKF